MCDLFDAMSHRFTSASDSDGWGSTIPNDDIQQSISIEIDFTRQEVKPSRTPTIRHC